MIIESIYLLFSLFVILLVKKRKVNLPWTHADRETAQYGVVCVLEMGDRWRNPSGWRLGVCVLYVMMLMLQPHSACVSWCWARRWRCRKDHYSVLWSGGGYCQGELYQMCFHRWTKPHRLVPSSHVSSSTRLISSSSRSNKPKNK